MSKKDSKTGSAGGRLISLQQASDYCGGVSTWTLRRWCTQRKLDSVKLGGRLLIPEAALAALIERGYRKANCPDEIRLA
jgi:excisionase family DNA binding protein